MKLSSISIPRLFTAFVLIVPFLIQTGCKQGVDLGSVTGQVTKNGAPQAKLWIKFAPAAGGRAAEATTNQEGHYELAYTGTKKGALVGRHHVSIMSGGEIDGRGNELSPRKEIYSTDVEVEGGSNELNFEIP